MDVYLSCQLHHPSYHSTIHQWFPVITNNSMNANTGLNSSLLFGASLHLPPNNPWWYRFSLFSLEISLRRKKVSCDQSCYWFLWRQYEPEQRCFTWPKQHHEPQTQVLFLVTSKLGLFSQSWSFLNNNIWQRFILPENYIRTCDFMYGMISHCGKTLICLLFSSWFKRSNKNLEIKLETDQCLDIQYFILDLW